jgi:hypothetical protein
MIGEADVLDYRSFQGSLESTALLNSADCVYILDQRTVRLIILNKNQLNSMHSIPLRNYIFIITDTDKTCGRVQSVLRIQIVFYGRYMILYGYRMQLFLLCVWL